MFKKLIKDVKNIDIELYNVLVEICNGNNITNKPLWLKFNRLYTTRVETLRLMRLGYTNYYGTLNYLPSKVVIQYCKAKKISIPDNTTEYETFKAILNHNKEQQ